MKNNSKNYNAKLQLPAELQTNSRPARRLIPAEILGRTNEIHNYLANCTPETRLAFAWELQGMGELNRLTPEMGWN